MAGREKERIAEPSPHFRQETQRSEILERVSSGTVIPKVTRSQKKVEGGSATWLGADRDNYPY